MEIRLQKKEDTLSILLEGRFDAFGANQLDAVLKEALEDGIARAILFMMDGVSYLSSAGLRVLLATYKEMQRRGGVMVLSGVQPYCREVIEMTGFAETFPMVDSPEEAETKAAAALQKPSAPERPKPAGGETCSAETGDYCFVSGSDDSCAAEILGDIRDILHSRVTTERIYSKRFFDKEYSIGMGGLGAGIEEYINLLGEMITIGGTMVWLPTDGHDTADFLIPKTDQGHVMIRTGFNVSIKGGVNEYVHFKSATAGGTPVGALYRELFAFAKKRRPDFRGALGLVIRAQLGAVYGSGIKKSAVTQNAPANGKMILHESNLAEWFDGDTSPRHTRVTGLIVGIGADLTADLSDYEEEDFNRVFYMHPVNISGKQELLHNHAVIFNEQPVPQHPAQLDGEIHRVIEQGTFLDMRHLLDSSTITEALIGIHYIQAFRPDPEGIPLDQDPAAPMPEIKKSQMKYYQA